jgi:hypothetical protein
MPPPGATSRNPSQIRRASDPGSPQKSDSSTVLDLAGELDNELMELKARYDQYFLGLEKIEPGKEREDLKKRIIALKMQSVRNTGARFKVGSLFQKYLTYERLWMRSAREREEGTYKADRFKARLHAAARKPSAPPRKAARDGEPKTDPNIQLTALQAPLPQGEDDFDIEEASGIGLPEPKAAAPARPPPPPPAAMAHRSVGSTGEIGEDKLRAIYNAYLTAKKRCNEPTQGVTFESVAASLKKQVPQIMRDYKARGVDFKVVIKDGKAILKALPKT